MKHLILMASRIDLNLYILSFFKVALLSKLGDFSVQSIIQSRMPLSSILLCLLDVVHALKTLTQAITTLQFSCNKTSTQLLKIYIYHVYSNLLFFQKPIKFCWWERERLLLGLNHKAEKLKLLSVAFRKRMKHCESVSLCIQHRIITQLPMSTKSVAEMSLRVKCPTEIEHFQVLFCMQVNR